MLLITNDGWPVAQPRFTRRPSARQDHAAAGVFERVAIDGAEVAGLDVDLLGLAGFDLVFEPGDVDLDIEVADVADDRVVLHLLHVLGADDVAAAGGGDEDVALRGGFFHRGDFEAFHRGLQGVDRVDLGDDHAGAVAPHAVGAALADVAIAGDDDDLAGDHHVGGPLDAVGQRLAAAVEVVELALGDRVVDVDRRAA